MTTINVNGVALGIESFGDHDAPLVCSSAGTTMLSWPDTFCERLAAAGRLVVRYDLRDSGESTTQDPEAPTYTLRDLAADAAALADALGRGPAHLAGIGDLHHRNHNSTPADSLSTAGSDENNQPRTVDPAAKITARSNPANRPRRIKQRVTGHNSPGLPDPSRCKH